MAPPIGQPLHNEAYAAARRAEFLTHLAEGFTIQQSALLAGIASKTVYNWRAEDEEFARDWEINYALGGEVLAKEAFRRAVHGVKKMKFHMGRVLINPDTGLPYVEHEYSDAMLMFLMQARDPLRYCSKARTAYIQRQWAEEDARKGKRDDSTKPLPEIIDMLDGLAHQKALTASNLPGIE